MDFTFTAEQEMLRDSLGKLLAQSYSFDQRQAIVRSPAGHSGVIWRQLGEMGLLALPFAEAQGGLGGSASDLIAIGELLGRHLVVEPYFGSILLGGAALALGGDRTRALLDTVIAGDALVALAHEERHGIGPVAMLGTTLAGGAEGLRLNGEKRLVLSGNEACALIVSARAGERLALVKVDPAANGVSINAYTTVDGRRAATVTFANVIVTPADVLNDNAEAALDRVIETATLALCAEGVGAMGALLEAASTYAATRKQFGTPIGAFQVIAHRLADMKIAHAKAHALLLYTTALVESGQGAGMGDARSIALLKAQIGRLGRDLGESAVQIHGGIGMTDELAVGHYHKRILAIDAMLGSSDYHLRRVGR
jgi:alkylation response protein AidB-like acyl-CoA dehydrogenase